MAIAQRRPLLVELICLLLCGTTSPCQSNSRNGPLKTFASSLQTYGIDLSEPSLIAALRNNTPQIRALAALQLAQDRDENAVPRIEEALADEKDPEAEIEISQALYSLHDPLGVLHLQTVCTKDSLPIERIIQAVGALDNAQQSSAACAGRILAVFDSNSSSEWRLQAVGALASMYPWVPRDQAERMAEILQQMLSDPDPSVRMQASHALVQGHVDGAQNALRHAIARETLPEVKPCLERDLSALSGKP